MRSGKMNYTLKKDSCERTCSPFSIRDKKNRCCCNTFDKEIYLGQLEIISHIQNKNGGNHFSTFHSWTYYA